ncbi:MAG: laccase domain-containing protein [Deltaproteobacteria bacterium]|nr:laccase domain-containing protein [Nannocystaceae bacterium]
MLDRSALLARVPGLVHGFTDREGGVSQGRYATLDMASKWGDDPEAVAENRRRVAEASGFEVSQLVLARQVHGVTSLHAHAVHEGSEADAVWCAADDRKVVGVLTADCVPILLADREGTVALAIHSGWRGTAADIVAAAIGGLPVAPDRLLAAIGPCIEQAAFEVGPEVAARFDRALVDDRGERPHLDLVEAVRRQLVAAGVATAAIERVGGCTHAHSDRWFSYRRDGAGIGQMLAFAGYPR